MHELTIYKTNARICLSLHFFFFFLLSNTGCQQERLLSNLASTSKHVCRCGRMNTIRSEFIETYIRILKKWKLKAKLSRSDEFDQGNGEALFADFQSGHVTILHATLFINAGRVGACAAALIHSQLRNNSRHRTRHLISTTGVRRSLTALDYSQWNVL